MRFENEQIFYFCSYECFKKEKEIYFLFKKLDDLKFNKFNEQLKNKLIEP